jgi:hypothetical protein
MLTRNLCGTRLCRVLQIHFASILSDPRAQGGQLIFSSLPMGLLLSSRTRDFHMTGIEGNAVAVIRFDSIAMEKTTPAV